MLSFSDSEKFVKVKWGSAGGVVVGHGEGKPFFCSSASVIRLSSSSDESSSLGTRQASSPVSSSSESEQWQIVREEKPWGQEERKHRGREETFRQEAGSEDANARPYLTLAASRLDMVLQSLCVSLPCFPSAASCINNAYPTQLEVSITLLVSKYCRNNRCVNEGWCLHWCFLIIFTLWCRCAGPQGMVEIRFLSFRRCFLMFIRQLFEILDLDWSIMHSTVKYFFTKMINWIIVLHILYPS